MRDPRYAARAPSQKTLPVILGVCAVVAVAAITIWSLTDIKGSEVLTRPSQTSGQNFR
jgi:hypothetical protein